MSDEKPRPTKLPRPNKTPEELIAEEDEIERRTQPGGWN